MAAEAAAARGPLMFYVAEVCFSYLRWHIVSKLIQVPYVLLIVVLIGLRSLVLLLPPSDTCSFEVYLRRPLHFVSVQGHLIVDIVVSTCVDM